MAPRKTPLRSVKTGETVATPVASKKVAAPTVSGAKSTRDLLVAMRNRIATAIDNPNTPARDLAALTKRISEVVRDIEALDARQAEDGSSETGVVEDGAFDASAV